MIGADVPDLFFQSRNSIYEVTVVGESVRDGRTAAGDGGGDTADGFGEIGKSDEDGGNGAIDGVGEGCEDEGQDGSDHRFKKGFGGISHYIILREQLSSSSSLNKESRDGI